MHYDEITGKIKGFYIEGIHQNIPSPVTQITEEKHQFYMDNNGMYKINILTLEDELIIVTELPNEPTELEVLKETNANLVATVDMILTEVIPSLIA